MRRRLNTSSRTPDIQRGLLVCAFVTISAACGYAALSASFRAGPQLATIRPSIVAVALGLACVNYFCRSLRWSLMCRSLGASAGVRIDGLYYVAGFPMAMTPGKLGEVMRLWLMRRGHGHAYFDTAPLLVADRAFDLLALAMIAALGATAFGGSTWMAFGGSALIASGCVLVISCPQMLRLGVEWVYSRVGRLPRLFARLRRVARSFERMGSLRLGAPALALSIVGWLAEVLIMKLVLGAMDETVSLAQAGFVFSAGIVLGALTLIPGGLGVTDLSMIGLLTALGVATPTATAAVLVVRACTLWFAVGVGLAATPFALWTVHRMEDRRADPVVAHRQGTP